MFEGSRGTDLADIPTAVAVKKRRSAPQLVWLIPIVAALVGGWIVIKGILDKGPTITISFKTAEGLEAGKTKVKFKSLEVGEVKSLAFDKERRGVVATVELIKQTEPYLVDDTQFWVVRPRFAGGQVSGLGTLFSGAYIAIDVGRSREPERKFTGLEVPPIVTANLAGREFVLRADTMGSLQVGSPLYFRHILTGQVVAFDLDSEGCVLFKCWRLHAVNSFIFAHRDSARIAESSLYRCFTHHGVADFIPKVTRQVVVELPRFVPTFVDHYG